MKELLLNEFKEIDILPLDHFDSNPEVAAQEAERIKRYMGRLGYTKVDKSPPEKRKSHHFFTAYRL